MKKMKKWGFIGVAAVALLGSLPVFSVKSAALECKDIGIIYVRGSGAPMGTDDFRAFTGSLARKLDSTGLSYSIYELGTESYGGARYPAEAIGFSTMTRFITTLGAFVSGGESYSYGESVAEGVTELSSYINSFAASCPEMKFVMGGHSQGAQVITETLPKVNPEKVIYAATFGDPKLYLPEGAGIYPDACKNVNLSEYRAYVPDCYTHEGILQGYKPYQSAGYSGKIGAWCNHFDIICSAHHNISEHTQYVEKGLYVDATNVIFAKINEMYGLNSKMATFRDTAILIDTTGSMSGFINDYKGEALRIARETMENGGRVALYEYRDLQDPFLPVEHCGFETCTMEKFQAELAGMKADGGGDGPESMLSASFSLMKNLHWQYGATKSVVVLTDADFHNPDFDGTTVDDVVKLSKEIDPVNFYVITKSRVAEAYADLAAGTDGKVYTTLKELAISTDFVLNRPASEREVAIELDSSTKKECLSLWKKMLIFNSWRISSKLFPRK